MTKPKAPAGLEAGGRRLWGDVVSTFDLRPDELRVLEAAARTTDLIARMDETLKGVPLMVSGSMGQDRPHPMLTEIRGHRALLGTLLKQLNLPDEGEEKRSRSESGAHAARSRWRVAHGA